MATNGRKVGYISPLPTRVIKVSSLELYLSPLSQKRLSPYVLKSTPPLKKKKMSKMSDSSFVATKGIRKPNKYRRLGSRNQLTRRLAYKGPKVYNFKRSWNAGTGSTVALTSTLYATNFSLNDIPGYLEFTSLFDYYKINAVRFRLLPFQTESNSTGTVNNAGNVPIFSVVDTSDATAPASVEELCEYQDHKITNLYNGLDVYFKPKFADATSAVRGGWVACSNPSLNWNGFKFAIPPTTNSMVYYLVWTFYVSFKDPK